ncbi:MAG: hypothetical protein CL775_04175 [Chloroflexi bacterium]|nr:hypothetical protein [Chloroflexota bacterium]
MLGWGLISILMGATLFYFNNDFIRGIGTQFLAWGLVNSLIGIFVILRKSQQNSKKLAKILLFNSFLDLIYLSVAIVLIFEIFINGDSSVGHGFGVLFQGFFLLILEMYYGIRILRI